MFSDSCMDGKKAAMPPCALNADLICGRDAIGDSSIIGDDRWAGTLGIRADFVARTHCSVAFIPTKDILVPLLKFSHPTCHYPRMQSQGTRERFKVTATVCLGNLSPSQRPELHHLPERHWEHIQNALGRCIWEAKSCWVCVHLSLRAIACQCASVYSESGRG